MTCSILSRSVFSKLFWALLLLAAAGGCTDLERGGVSSIPRNRPAQWETRPYGDVHN